MTPTISHVSLHLFKNYPQTAFNSDVSGTLPLFTLTSKTLVYKHVSGSELYLVRRMACRDNEIIQCMPWTGEHTAQQIIIPLGVTL